MTYRYYEPKPVTLDDWLRFAARVRLTRFIPADIDQPQDELTDDDLDKYRL